MKRSESIAVVLGCCLLNLEPLTRRLTFVSLHYISLHKIITFPSRRKRATIDVKLGKYLRHCVGDDHIWPGLVDVELELFCDWGHLQLRSIKGSSVGQLLWGIAPNEIIRGYMSPCPPKFTPMGVTMYYNDGANAKITYVKIGTYVSKKEIVKAKLHYTSWFRSWFKAKFHYAIWFEPAPNQLA